MSDRRTASDEVARRAARMWRDGGVTDLARAIDAALGRAPAGTPRPSESLVRRHVQGFELEESGAEAYARRVRGTLAAIAEWMETLAGLPGEPPVHLVGRAALGLLDAECDVHLRVSTERPLAEIAATLVAHGAPEPEFSTVHGPYGDFGRLAFADPPFRIRVTRCPPETRARPDRDLVTGRRQASLDLAAVRARLELPEAGSDQG